jgi:hypothetical protein
VRRAIVLAVLASASIARADAVLPGGDELVLAPDEIATRITVEVELARGLRGTPTSVAPDLWLGLGSRLTVGIIHSNASLSRIDRASSFCFGHDDVYGCDRTYHNAGAEARYLLRDGSLAVAAHTRFLIRDVDPWKPAVTAGAAVRWSHGRWTLSSDPYLRIGIANTDRGNRTNVMLPLVAALRVIARTEVAVHTGYDSDVKVWHDGFHIPLALTARAIVTDHVELGVTGGFTSAFGPQDTLTRSTIWFWFAWNS